MLKNIHLKIFALILATVFWLLIVSLENTFYEFPTEIPIQIFNLSQDLGLASKLGVVHLAVRAQDAVTVRTLSAGDFEAYVDLRDVGAGARKVPVLVTSKNPSVSVLRVEPSEVEVNLEPIREKLITLRSEVSGQPAKGFSTGAIKLSQANILISGAESILKKAFQAKALVVLNGTEKINTLKPVEITIYDLNGIILDGVKIKSDVEISANIEILESESTKQVGIKPILTGKLTNGVIKKIEVDPAIIEIKGRHEVLDALNVLVTKDIDLTDVQTNFSKKVGLKLPPGIELVDATQNEITVTVEIEKQ